MAVPFCLARAFQHAFGKRAFLLQQMQNAMFDAVFAHQVDDGDMPCLVLAPGAGDALLKPRRIPRQIEIDDDVGSLQVEAGGAGIAGQQQATVGVLFEAIQFTTAGCCGTLPVCSA